MSPGKPDAGAAGIGQRDCLSFVSTRRDVTEVQRTLTGCQLDLRAGARGRAARIAQASHQNYCKSKVYPLRTNRFLRKAAESRFSQAADKLRLHVLPPGRPAKHKQGEVTNWSKGQSWDRVFTCPYGQSRAHLLGGQSGRTAGAQSRRLQATERRLLSGSAMCLIARPFMSVFSLNPPMRPHGADHQRGRTHASGSRLDSVADERFGRVTGRIEA